MSLSVIRCSLLGLLVGLLGLLSFAHAQDDNLDIPGLITPLSGHSESVYAVAYHPKGTMLATGGFDKAIHLYDTNGQPLRSYTGARGHKDLVLCLDFAPDGNLLASGSSDKTVKLWPVPSQAPVQQRLIRAEVTSFALSPDHKRAAVGTQDGGVQVWSLEHNKELFRLNGHVGSVTVVRFSGNGQFLVSGGEDRTLRWWKATDGTQLGTIGAHPGSIRDVQVHPDGSLIYSLGQDNLVKAWQTRKLEAQSLPSHRDRITAFALASDGSQVVTGGHDHMVRLSQTDDGKQLKEFATPGPVASVGLAPNRDQIAAGLSDGRLLFWGNRGNRQGAFQAHKGATTGIAYHLKKDHVLTVGEDGWLKQWQLPLLPSTNLNLPEQITASVLWPDGKRALIATRDRELRLWRLENLRTERSFKGLRIPASAIAVTPDGSTIAAADAQGQIQLWNAANGQSLGYFQGHTGKVTALAFSPGYKQLASVGEDGLVKCWRYPLVKPQLLNHPKVVRRMCLSKDGNRLLTLADDQRVRIWNLVNGQVEHNYQVDQQPLKAVAYAADGRSVALATHGKGIHVFRDGNQVHHLEDLPAGVQAMTLTADGKRLIAGFQDSQLRVYDLGQGREIERLSGHEGSVLALSYSAEQSLVVSVGQDKTVHFWPLNEREPQRTLELSAVPVAMALSQDGKVLALATDDQVVSLWQLAESEQPTRIDVKADIRGLDLSADGEAIAVVCADQQVRLFAADGQLLESLPQAGPTTTVAIHPDGQRLITANEDNTVNVQTRRLRFHGAHDGAVRQVVYAANSNRLFSVGDDRHLRIWDTSNGEERRVIQAHTGEIVCLAVREDGRQVVTMGTEGRVCRWSSEDGKRLGEITVSGTGKSMALSRDGRRLVIGSKTKGIDRIDVYDIPTGMVLQTLTQGPTPIQSVSFTPDSNRVFVVDRGRRVRLLHAAVMRAYPAHEGGAMAVVYHPNGSQAFTAGKDRLIKHWDLNDGKLLRTIGPLADAVVCLDLTLDQQQLAAGSGKQIKLFQVHDGTEVASLTHDGAVTSVAFSGDRQRLVVGTTDNLAQVWDLTTGQRAEFIPYGGAVRGVGYHPNQPMIFAASEDKTAGRHPVRLQRLIVPSEKPTHVLGMLPNGSRLLTAAKDHGLTLWNTTNGNQERRFAGVQGPIQALAVSRDNQLVAVSGGDQQVRIFTVNDGQLRANFSVPEVVDALAFHPNRQVLAGAFSNGKIIAWNANFKPGQPVPATMGKPLAEFQHQGRVAGLSFTDQGILVSASADQSMRSWQLAGDEPVKELGHPDIVDSVAFDPTGKLLATGCHDGKVRLWDIEQGKSIREIDAHTKPNKSAVYRVSFSPDGKQLVSASFDQTLKLWTVADGKLVREIAKYEPGKSEQGHRQGVFCAAFSPDGKFLVSGSSDRSLKLWKVSDGSLVRDFENPNFARPQSPISLPVQAHPSWIYEARFINDGQTILSAGGAPRYHGYLAWWNVEDGQLNNALELPTGKIQGLAVAPNGTRLAIACAPNARGKPEGNGYLLNMPRD